jgi:predicted flap endonuclease-1-like 5' DNA nuclease
MAENPTYNEIDLESFLKTAVQSFTDAQKSLLHGQEVSVNMMLSNAELELKVAVNSDAQGKLRIRPISSEDITTGKIDPNTLSTIRINFVSSIGEITRQPISPIESTSKGNVVPNLIGQTLDQSAAVLKREECKFELHAASRAETAAADQENPGRILRQQPTAGQTAEKANITVHIWADLGNTPVKDIVGIGTKFGENLSNIGINSIGELSLAKSEQIASALKISETRARGLVDMAALMSRLAISGLKDEIVELLVKGADVRTIEQLAKAEAGELLRICQESIVSKKVRVPRGFNFNTDDVQSWINTAQNFPGA